MRKPKVEAYCMARISTALSTMGTLAWLKAKQPASTSCAISDSLSPLKPMVSEPTG
jgi:hypothetical protein